MGVLAGATKKVKIGTAVLVMPYRTRRVEPNAGDL